MHVTAAVHYLKQIFKMKSEKKSFVWKEFRTMDGQSPADKADGCSSNLCGFLWLFNSGMYRASCERRANHLRRALPPAHSVPIRLTDRSHGSIALCMHRCSGRTDGWMDGWMDGWDLLLLLVICQFFCRPSSYDTCRNAPDHSIDVVKFESWVVSKVFPPHVNIIIINYYY